MNYPTKKNLFRLSHRKYNASQDDLSPMMLCDRCHLITTNLLCKLSIISIAFIFSGLFLDLFICLLRGSRWDEFLVRKTSASQIGWWSKTQVTSTSWSYCPLWFVQDVFTQAAVSTPTHGMAHSLELGPHTHTRHRQTGWAGYRLPWPCSFRS